MIIKRNKVSGIWIISEIIAGYLFTRKYIGYTKKEAIREFKKEIKSILR